LVIRETRFSSSWAAFAKLPAFWFSGKIADVKTTLDLPAPLVRQLKLRAAHEGRKLKDVAAEALEAGLKSVRPSRRDEPLIIRKDKKTGLPVIISSKSAQGRNELTPDDIAQILLDQESEWALDSGR